MFRGVMFCHALVIRRCGCCGGLPFVSGWVCSQEYEGGKWRRTPGGHAIWLLCLECHHQKWQHLNFQKVVRTLRCYQIHSLKINKSNTELWLLGLPGWQLIFQKGLIIISFIFLPINIPSQHIQDTFGLEARWIVQSEAPGTLVICIALYSPVNMRILYL